MTEFAAVPGSSAEPVHPEASPPDRADAWLALVVGNSRLHWALFTGTQIECVWHTPHWRQEQVQPLQAQGFSAQSWRDCLPSAVADCWPQAREPLPLWLAGVVREQCQLWQVYPSLQWVHLDQVPLSGVYPTLGVDRALSLLGAGRAYGWPMLVVDAGTALTYTAGTDQGLLGGAILPGLTLQAKALAQGTDALPQIEWSQTGLPQRWATSTAEAIQSGILYAQLAGVRDYLAAWQQQFPAAQVVLTGGDGPILMSGLRQTAPETAQQIKYDPNLMFWGLAACHSATDR